MVVLEEEVGVWEEEEEEEGEEDEYEKKKGEESPKLFFESITCTFLCITIITTGEKLEFPTAQHVKEMYPPLQMSFM